MFENLESVERRFEEIDHMLMQSGIDGKELTKLSRERASIEDLVTGYRQFRDLSKRREDAKAMLLENDEEMRTLAKEELGEIEVEIAACEKNLILLMLPSDPNDAKNVILEVRAGTGGEEAALFAADLLRMYTRYCDRVGWRTELLSSTGSEKGGFREAIMMIEGTKVFSRLKFESGAHRVQRVPETEAQGRVHTSACTVAILPEADEVEINVRPEELEISVCRASGAGGQSVNTADSAVRIVHLPTGIVVECQDERSQLKNKAKGMKILMARILERAQKEQHDAISADRKSQVGSGDRSERIRTYNFPQGRLTDHRIDLTLYKLSEIINGDLDEVLDRLGMNHQAELLKRELTKTL